MKKKYIAPKIVSLEIFAENSIAAGSNIESNLEINPNSSSITLEDWSSEDGFTNTEYTLN
ncbi:hypothetical protein [Sphingobacterium rhinopitheci]|uniref:hypothetical protein n=1 Tax=Sphingobacterium rhinopitheci TaxID=2781960 RepID=UPI001F51A93E|nr:hypothetical protein [Sphingobacterium rhinopitheci]MCI0921234.1 hypothetical protein [Sphingobacterium rhinopitheci]